MAQITGGKVSYGRTFKTGDYESKRCDVELAFSVSEGEDYSVVFDLTSRQVIRRFNEMTGAKDAIPEFAGVLVVPPKARLPQAAEIPANTVAQTDIEDAITEAKPAKRGPGRPKKEVAAKPKPEPEVEAAEDRKADECVAGLENEPEDVITDNELVQACTRAATKIGPDKVKSIRNSFTGDVAKQIKELEQGKRRAFLKAMADATAEADAI